MRKCGRCKITQPLENFHKGSVSYCKPCRADYRSSLRRSRSTAEVAAGEAKDRAYRWKRYGASDDQVYLLEDAYQHGVSCAICGVELLRDAVQVDHCHSSMVVRGILCGHCNAGLGHFMDDTDRLMSAIKYLNEVSNDEAYLQRQCSRS